MRTLNVAKGSWFALPPPIRFFEQKKRNVEEIPTAG
jgi:hypothetical protein